MFGGLHQISEDRRLAERLGGFEPVQPFDQDIACAVQSDQDRRLLAFVEHALGNFQHVLRLERRTALGRNVDVVDWQSFALEHANRDASTNPNDQGNCLCHTIHLTVHRRTAEAPTDLVPKQATIV